MTYEEFRIGILKANQKKHHFRVNNSLGIDGLSNIGRLINQSQRKTFG